MVSPVGNVTKVKGGRKESPVLHDLELCVLVKYEEEVATAR